MFSSLIYFILMPLFYFILEFHPFFLKLILLPFILSFLVFYDQHVDLMGHYPFFQLFSLFLILKFLKFLILLTPLFLLFSSFFLLIDLSYFQELTLFRSLISLKTQLNIKHQSHLLELLFYVSLLGQKDLVRLNLFLETNFLAS